MSVIKYTIIYSYNFFCKASKGSNVHFGLWLFAITVKFKIDKLEIKLYHQILVIN